MRRFSQRNTFVTLSDINITPLLDLAFVLLIIFVIISPSIRSSDQHGMDLNLPQGGQERREKFEKKDVRIVEVNAAGNYMLGGKRMSPDAIEAELIRTRQQNPQLVVLLRADGKTALDNAVRILSVCQTHRIRMNLSTDPLKR